MVHLKGTLSSDPVIGLSAQGAINLQLLCGGVSASGELSVQVNQSEVFVKVKGNINLGLLGNAVIVGTIDSRNDHASLFVGFNVYIIGVQLCGYVETRYEQGSYKARRFYQ